jgi:hypothetical protein
MPIVRLVPASRKLLAVGLIGALAFVFGCDSGGGGGGESNVAPTTPPPGKSADDMKKAMQDSFGPKGVPDTKGGPRKAP